MRFVARCRRWINNQQLVSAADCVNLWVDDERPAPEGWYHATTVAEAKNILETCLVWHMSLDHDLGTPETGYDLVKWLAEVQSTESLNFWPVNRPQVHSQNVPGSINMLSVIERYGPYKDRRDP